MGNETEGTHSQRRQESVYTGQDTGKIYSKSYRGSRLLQTDLAAPNRIVAVIQRVYPVQVAATQE